MFAFVHKKSIKNIQTLNCACLIVLYSIPQTMCSKINNVLSTKDVWLNTAMFEYKTLCCVHYV